MANRSTANQLPTDVAMQIVAILGVDPTTYTAQGMTQFNVVIPVNFGFLPGGMHITPSVGDQWVVQRIQSKWMLLVKMPVQTPEMINNPGVPGQVQVGSLGPLQLNGSTVEANGPMVLQTTTTSGRPLASSLPAGATMYDTTLSKVIISDSLVWRDCLGSTV